MTVWTAADPGEVVLAVGALLEELTQRPEMDARRLRALTVPDVGLYPGPYEDRETANAVCAVCLVRVNCFDYAETDGDATGSGRACHARNDVERSSRRSAA